jgi:hypothetical protein
MFKTCAAKWEHFSGNGASFDLYRMIVPGGWLVYVDSEHRSEAGLTFLPDPKHTWRPDVYGKESERP